MYLKSLEIIGFKSFADRTRLDFHPGVTSIVGPNGCGKSNVLDAIRWVLGEQSAKALRGGEMADVIFSGTDDRKALGMAEVTLTFADCAERLDTDWNEVAVSRRVFRDGKGEYLLNGTSCRLRDIQDLFVDTGIGRTSYSIMEQGRIDLLLSSRPEDRRTVFEEAAGITKFKQQKKEALRKLEYTEANLVRIGDLMKEVKRQLRSLQRQAGKARRYQEISQSLKTLDCAESRRQLTALDDELREVRQRTSELTKKEEHQEQRILEMENALGGRRERQRKLDDKVAEVRQKITELKNQISNRQSRIEFNTERLEEFKNLIERYSADREVAEEKIAEQRKEVERLEGELAELDGQGGEDEQKLSDEQTRLTEVRRKRREAEEKLQNTQRTINRTESLLGSLHAEIQRGFQQKESGQKRLESLENEQQQLEKSLEELRGELEDQQKTVAAAEEELEARKQDRQNAEARRVSSQENLRKHDKTLDDAQRRLSRLSSRVEALENFIQRGEGFDAITQKLLRKEKAYAPLLTGDPALLANTLQAEKNVATAVEAALGARMQTVILDASTDLAALLAEMNKREKSGAVRLAQGTVLAETPGWQTQMIPEGAMAWALDKVECGEHAAEQLAYALLHRVVICQDFASALEVRKNDPELACATLDGHFISEQGVIEWNLGDPAERQKGVLHRRNELAVMQKDRDALRKEVGAAEKQRETLSAELHKAEDDLQKHRDAAGQAQSQLEDQRNRVKTLERQVAEQNRRLQRVNWEREEILTARRLAEQTIQDQKEEIAAQEETLNTARSQVSDQEEALEAARQEEAAQNEALSDLRVKVLSRKQNVQNVRNLLKTAQNRLDELKDTIRQRVEDIKEYQVRTEMHTRNSEELTREIEEMRDNFTEAERERGQLEDLRAQVAKELLTEEAQINQVRTAVAEFQKEKGQLEVRATQVELRRENLLNNIHDRYNLDLTEHRIDLDAVREALEAQQKQIDRDVFVDPEEQPAHESATGAETADSNADTENPSETETETAPQTIDWDAVAELIGALKKRLESLGPVNLEAIEEFDEVQDRDKFYTQQHDDLTKSREQLLDVIQKLNKTSQLMFAETFAKVKKNFGEMFKILFGGGQADLELLDSEDPLESGIDITAKPPGKRPTSVSLLSGGERTMTAVALLFAIYMVKPSPFCILDEMDAPLDESNIDRFLKILDRFVNQSQFIVITHNKRTISRADVLYGVTMQERGVSRLVGVRLSDPDQVEKAVEGEAGNAAPDEELALS